MMLKANGEYLDFNGDIDIESSIKLFDQIDKSSGEFSYDIAFDDNGHNRRILGIPRADTVKIIYQNVPAEVIDDTGESIYLGKLQVNRIENRQIISTFFAGNADWFAQLSEPMSSLPLYRYDVDLTEATIQASWLNDSGIVFPIVDAGALVSRSYPNLKVEDFIPWFYVKTLFDEIFNPLGIKVQGDLTNDAIFKKLTIANNGTSQDDIDARSCYVNKTSGQAISALTKATFQDDSTFPFFDGSLNNFSNSSYTSHGKQRGNLEVSFTISGSFNFMNMVVYVNGVPVPGLGFTFQANPSIDIDITLNDGDVVEIYTNVGIGTVTLTGGFFRFTPKYIYRIFGTSSVPNWTKGEFVSNILRIFNALPSYNLASKTLTLDLFNKIKEKPYIDVSDEIVINTIDFSEFVSPYGKNNIFRYQESEDEDLRKYNISNFISYGSGNLTIDNNYIDNNADIIESDFTSPITYLNGIFDMSMERINFVELEEIENEDITSVTDSSGTPRFNITNADDTFAVGDLVRLETTVDAYNGDWVVNAVTTTYIVVNGLAYDSAASGSATLLRHKFTTDDNVYLFVNVPNVSNSFFTSKSTMYLESATSFTTSQIAYFNLLSNGTPINKVYKQSLSFGAPNNPLNYQITMLDSYWPLFSRILNNPVMALATGYFKRKTYDEIKSFLRPLMIRTEETVNLYYMNRVVGYKGSERGCDTQLIKLN